MFGRYTVCVAVSVRVATQSVGGGATGVGGIWMLTVVGPLATNLPEYVVS